MARKRTIPQAVRREVALRSGGVPGESVPGFCSYCGREGRISWFRKADGKPGAWVHFRDLELDHVEAEHHGGAATAANIRLACRTCNRRKGHRSVEYLLAENERAKRDARGTGEEVS